MTFDITVRRGDQPPTSDFDPKTWYRLTNTYKPKEHCLDVINDNGTDSAGLLQMVKTKKDSGQY